MLGHSVPAFWLGIVLILVFAVCYAAADLRAGRRHYVMPTSCLAGA